MPELATPSISLVVLAYNEASNLPACLESVVGLDCELFVVDSGSTDRTVEIARQYGARVYSHPFENYARQRNWAQQHLPLAASWVLHLDADERLTPELVEEINGMFRRGEPGEDGFLFRKRTFFMGRWIRHGGHYPSFHLRLFRRDRGRCEDRLYDQHFVVDGRVRVLRHDYVDVLTSDLGTWTARHNRWAELEAREILNRSEGEARVRADAFGNPIERRRWLREGFYGRWPLFARAFLYWGYRYFLRLGFLDGTPGLIFHFLQGCWFRFLVDAKIYEYKMRAAAGAEEKAEAAAPAVRCL
ncbi:MAG TPA: glycosyltransferase family 2 protein [Terriglobales bacterium]|nr:glycosyltransferase family 2 protein [Terriglobales bacterium]